ncbi:predicted protein [Micromonas commoda]|uniref:Protein kinase domain-containing protein n=1 Tax=Micromonas commoda (strain RCC299 / NOUM17 / CCMP2709) TaxID=296587 RepID=C1FJ70_MICCC|nr:predicted protein [Micromonas commoda]ACO70538.1 predicted protein [Micromonas commoda]|eukprot:XP_002509280.1 predicted protein [Micromonas commoda]
MLEHAKVDNLPSFLSCIRENAIDLMSINSRNTSGTTALHVAAANGCMKVLAHLVTEVCVDINAADNWTRTALDEATKAGHEDAVRYLLAAGARHGTNIDWNRHRGEPIETPPRTSASPEPDEWELLPWDVKVDDVVGEGAFGEIRCGRWRGSPVAIKTLKSDCMTDAIALKEFNCEMSIWCRLVHPNIVQFLGVGYKAGQPPIMVCELMGGGSLQQKLLELQSWGKKMDFDRAFKIASNVAAALNYMHSRRPYAVIHRDLKPANILLTSNGVAKVADFGLSKMFDITTPREPAREENDDTGAYKYMAPEVFKHEFYGLKCDVYSYAMVVYEVFEGLLAFGDPITWAHRAASSEKARPGWNFMAAYESRRCEEMCKLVEQCWHSDPKERPTFMRIANVLRSIGYISKFEKRPELTAKGKKGGAAGAAEAAGCNCVVM